jgi:hypothetical protein
MDVLVRKIKKLQRITPNASWLESQKSFLLYEISRPKETEKREKSILAFPLFNFSKIFKPAFAFALTSIILVSSVATVGVISASQGTLPGDFLYPVKTAIEKTQLTFSSSPESRTKLSIKFATQRIDEFTQLIEKPDKGKDIGKTVQKFTQEMVTVQQNINTLKEKNIQKATEVAKIVQAQTPIYKEALTNSAEKLGYVLPEEREKIAADINQALEEVSKTKEITDELAGGENTQTMTEEEQNQTPEEIITPTPDEKVESGSVPFETIQPDENEAENKVE